MAPEAWLTYSGSALSAEDQGFRSDSITIAAQGGSLASATAANDPAVTTAAERVPAGTFAFQAGVLPENALAGVPFALAAMVNEATMAGDEAMTAMPTAEEIEAQIAEASAELGFDPRTDFVDLLGNEFVAFADLPNFAFDGFSWDAVAAIPTVDPDALAETTRKLAAWIDRSQSNVDITVRREGDDIVYVVTDTENEDTPAVEFGVVGGDLVVGTGGGINQLAATPTSALADDPQFQAVMDELPAEFYQVGYVDIGQAIDLVSMFIGMIEGAPSPDADPACADFASQEEAQTAYDEDQVANAGLDLDFDGLACEDAFPAQMAAAGSLGNIRALGWVSFQRGDAAGSSAILYIPEPGS
jgi:hypothetical protein